MVKSEPGFEDLMRIFKVQRTVTSLKNKADFSNSIGKKVTWRENFPVVQGNDVSFPRISGKFSIQGLLSVYSRKSARFLG
jgi:hypothetical protein